MEQVLRVAGRYRILDLRPGWTLRLDPSAHRVVSGSQLEDPVQVAELDEFIDTCTPGMVLFDVGAHFGVFALAAVHYGGEAARVVAVEPSESACRTLSHQAKLNGVQTTINVVQAAAGEVSGWVNMVATGVLADGYFVPDDGGRPAADLTRVRAVTVDELVRETGLHPTHLKIDVEGQEAAVLRGAQGLLSGPKSPLLFLELHTEMIRDRAGDPTEALRLLEEYGYADISIAGRSTSHRDLLALPLARIVARTPD